MKEIHELATRFNCSFQNPALVQQAFVHRSYLNEHPNFPVGHNERLEFLGDAVLELIITEFLYNYYPNSPEGELTNWRASLVNANMLSQIAMDMGLDKYLYLSRGEAKDSTGRARRYILANVIEALIGAFYLDQGLESTRSFVQKYIFSKLPAILENKSYLDPKSKFQEHAQEILSITPHYQVLSETGPDHAKAFQVGVYLDKELVATGEGPSKQEAEIQAAEKALQVKSWE